MKLNKIKISGIFNLKDVEISLDDLSALIAPNNYGKSNVLRAIDFGVFFMEASLKRKLSLMRNRSLIPINTALEGTPSEVISIVKIRMLLIIWLHQLAVVPNNFLSITIYWH